MNPADLTDAQILDYYDRYQAYLVADIPDDGAREHLRRQYLEGARGNPDALEQIADILADENITLEDAVRAELVYLWSDLDTAVRFAHRGCWSGACENVAYRIGMLSRLVGATSWREVQVPLVRSGVYERVHRDAGLESPPIDWDAVSAFERRRAEEKAR